MPRDCLSKVRNSQNKVVVAKVSSNSSTPGISPDVAALTIEVSELKNMMKTMLVEKQRAQAPAPVKAVEESCVTCGGAHSYQTCPATTGNVVQPPAYQAPAYQAPAPQIQGVSKEDFQAYVKANDAVMRNMQTQAYKGPTIHTTSSPKVVEREPEVTKDTMLPTNNGSTEDVQPPVVPVVHHESISEPVNAPVSASRPNQKASIPFPSRRNDERRREKANDQIEKFYEIFRDLSFEISFTDALMLMPKFASTLKTLIGNKEKLSEMARTPLNENCSAQKRAAKIHDSLALVAHTYASSSSSRSPPDYYVTQSPSMIVYDDDYQGEAICDDQEDKIKQLCKMIECYIQSRNVGNSGRYVRRTTDNQGDSARNGNVQIKTRNGIAKGHYARDCPKLMARDSKYFQEHMLLAKKDEAEILLINEHNDFLLADASEVEEFEVLNATVFMMAQIHQTGNDYGNELNYDF
ncbi:hypothetical protein Tco_0497953 [Tanacetum coccineum]